MDFSIRISPFGNLRINGYLLLPAAYRSLSRPSSAPSAKAFALRPSSLDLFSRFEFLSLRELFFLLVLVFQLRLFVVFYPNFFVLKTLLRFVFTSSIASYSVFKVLLQGCISFRCWWAQMGSNHRPRAYQARALAY